MRKRLFYLIVVGVLAVAAALRFPRGIVVGARAEAQRHFNASEHAAHQADFETAMKEMRLAVSTDPHYVEAWDGLAALYTAQDRVDEGVAVFNDALKAMPGDHRIYYLLGQLYFAAQRYPQSIDCANKCLQTHPNDAHYRI